MGAVCDTSNCSTLKRQYLNQQELTYAQLKDHNRRRPQKGDIDLSDDTSKGSNGESSSIEEHTMDLSMTDAETREIITKFQVNSTSIQDNSTTTPEVQKSRAMMAAKRMSLQPIESNKSQDYQSVPTVLTTQEGISHDLFTAIIKTPPIAPFSKSLPLPCNSDDDKAPDAVTDEEGGSDLESPRDGDNNLFRRRSRVKWKTSTIISMESDMQSQLEHLVSMTPIPEDNKMAPAVEQESDEYERAYTDANDDETTHDDSASDESADDEEVRKPPYDRRHTIVEAAQIDAQDMAIKEQMDKLLLLGISVNESGD